MFADIRQNRPAIDAYLAEAATVPGVLEVSPLQVSPGGAVAIAPITIVNDVGGDPAGVADRLEDLGRPLAAEGVDVQFGGQWFNDVDLPRERSWSGSSPRSSCC